MASFGNLVLKRSQGARDEGRLGELRRPRTGRQSVGLNETYLPVPISYDPQSREVVVNSVRSAETYGKEFHLPELKSVSSAGSNLVEAMQRSLYHELGHSIIDAAGPETEMQVRRLLRGGRVMPVSLLAREEAVEYFCETFAAYRFEDGLADKDPEGYDMVEAILRMVF
jgi:hypothetical protein